MRMTFRAVVFAALVLALLAFPAAAFAKTRALQPFPTNLDTVSDATQVTGLQVDLPKPDCASFPSDCADIGVLDTLDGFNIQPRISIPFSGGIDLSTVNSSNIFLVGPGGHVGINQAVWEPLTHTLHVESDQQLAEATTYLLVVKRDVRDANGKRLEKFKFPHKDDSGAGNDRAAKDYRKALKRALKDADIAKADIAAASLFTTQSITAISTKIRAQLQATPVSFGDPGARNVFPLSSVTAILWNRQLSAMGPLAAPVTLPTPALVGVGTIAFGTYASPDYENADEVIPAVGSLTGVPAVQSTNQLQFTLFAPAGPTPAGGWPVAIFGHGFTDSKNGAPSPSRAHSHATASRRSRSTSSATGSAQQAPTPWRATTGPRCPRRRAGAASTRTTTARSTRPRASARSAPDSLIGNRDGLRQTVIDLMQLVKELHAGIDVDGDGQSDLSTSRIYYSGPVVRRHLRDAAPRPRAGHPRGRPNVPGGPIIEIARLSPAFRPLVGIALITRTPSLYNDPVPDPRSRTSTRTCRSANLPLIVDTVAGAEPIANLIDNTEWAQQAGNPAAYAPHLTHPVIFQFARGDQTVPNPTTSAIMRACDLRERATLFRNDLARPAFGTSANPHTFLTNIVGPAAPFAFAAQQQIATFFNSDGATTIDPDGAGVFFETPTSMVPEDLGFIP